MNVNEMLPFTKALADADRLRIVGLLTQKPAYLSEISQTLDLHPAHTGHHLNLLRQAGVVQLVEGVYQLEAERLEKLARRQFEGRRPTYPVEPDLEEKRRRILAAHLNLDGTIKQIPAQPARRQVLLEHVINAFSPGENYNEKEVNLILAHFHPDTAALRRYLVDAGMLGRESNGSRYWRRV
jgi:hypothetical protein